MIEARLFVDDYLKTFITESEREDGNNTQMALIQSLEDAGIDPNGVYKYLA